MILAAITVIACSKTMATVPIPQEVLQEMETLNTFLPVGEVKTMTKPILPEELHYPHNNHHHLIVDVHGMMNFSRLVSTVKEVVVVKLRETEVVPSLLTEKIRCQDAGDRDRRIRPNQQSLALRQNW